MYYRIKDVESFIENGANVDANTIIGNYLRNKVFKIHPEISTNSSVETIQLFNGTDYVEIQDVEELKDTDARDMVWFTYSEKKIFLEEVPESEVPESEPTAEQYMVLADWGSGYVETKPAKEFTLAEAEVQVKHIMQQNKMAKAMIVKKVSEGIRLESIGFIYL